MKTYTLKSRKGGTAKVKEDDFWNVISDIEIQFARRYDSGLKRDKLNFLLVFLKKQAIQRKFNVIL